MAKSDDFYFERLAQVKLPRWSFGSVGLLGDSAACATPFSGQGASLALYGGYVLAGELGLALRDGQTIPDALARYEAVARPYVKRVQAYPPILARLALPQTRLGVWVLHGFVALFARLKAVGRALEWLVGDSAAEIENYSLPEYTWADA